MVTPTYSQNPTPFRFNPNERKCLNELENLQYLQKNMAELKLSAPYLISEATQLSKKIKSLSNPSLGDHKEKIFLINEIEALLRIFKQSVPSLPNATIFLPENDETDNELDQFFPDESGIIEREGRTPPPEIIPPPIFLNFTGSYSSEPLPFPHHVKKPLSASELKSLIENPMLPPSNRPPKVKTEDPQIEFLKKEFPHLSLEELKALLQ
ncbi:MAG: hypothetical protein WCP39_02580 [Chlamydiota bacterium]